MRRDTIRPRRVSCHVAHVWVCGAWAILHTLTLKRARGAVYTSVVSERVRPMVRPASLASLGRALWSGAPGPAPVGALSSVECGLSRRSVLAGCCLHQVVASRAIPHCAPRRERVHNVRLPPLPLCPVTATHSPKSYVSPAQPSIFGGPAVTARSFPPPLTTRSLGSPPPLAAASRSWRGRS